MVGGLDPTPPALRHSIGGAGGGRSNPPKQRWGGISGRAKWSRNTTKERQKDREKSGGNGNGRTAGKKRERPGESAGPGSGAVSGGWLRVSGRGGRSRGPGWRSVQAL